MREELQQAQTDSETALLSAEVFIQSHISLKLSLTCLEKPDSVHDLNRYFDIQNAFTGSASQTGPPIAICKLILGMKFISKHGQAQLLDRSVCTLIGDCKVSFLDSQINGAVFMLQRSCGRIPIDSGRVNDPELAKAAKKLESIQTFGGIVVDTMGFGKTYTALLFLAYYARCMTERDVNIIAAHRPALCIAPSGIVLHQWQEEIIQFPTITLIIAHGDRPINAKFAINWVSATAMREAPRKLTNWPPHLRYIFD